MARYQDDYVEQLWLTWQAARADCHAAEDALFRSEQSVSGEPGGPAHRTLRQLEQLRARRDEAVERYQTIDRRFVAFRDAYLLGASPGA